MEEVHAIHLIDEKETMWRTGDIAENGGSVDNAQISQDGRTLLNGVFRDYVEALKNAVWSQTFVVVKTVQKPKLYHLRGKGWFVLCPMTGQSRRIGETAAAAKCYLERQIELLNWIGSQE